MTLVNESYKEQPSGGHGLTFLKAASSSAFSWSVLPFLRASRARAAPPELI